MDKGELRQGMNTNAVLIAWGRPTNDGTISTPNGPFVVWEYYRRKPTTEDPFDREIWGQPPTPVPEGRVFPHVRRTISMKDEERLVRTAVFHNDRLVNWTPK